MALLRWMILLVWLPGIAWADLWDVVAEESEIRFRVGYVGGLSLNATFPTFAGRLRFDPDQPATAAGQVVVNARSARTGLGFVDALIRSEAYLNAEAQPRIAFDLVRLDQTGPSTATIFGEVTVRATTRPMELQAVLTQLDRADGRAAFRLTSMLDRRDFGIIADLETVAAMIPIEIDLVLTRSDPGR